MYLADEFCNPFDGNPENFLMKLEHCGRYQYAYDNIKKTDIVADIACATGYGSYFLAQKAKVVIGGDCKEVYLDYAKHNCHAPNISYVSVDLEKGIKVLEKRNINKIICFETLEHTRCPLKIISAFYDLLPPKGEVILSFPNKAYELFDENGKNQDPYHLSEIDLKEFLIHVTKEGFRVKNIFGQTMINDLVKQSADFQRKYHLSLDELYHYDIESILYFSRRFAYPNDFEINHSYSFIIHLQK